MLGKRTQPSSSSTCCGPNNNKKTKHHDTTSCCISSSSSEWDRKEASELAKLLHQIGSNPHHYSFGRRLNEKEGFLLGYPGLKIHQHSPAQAADIHIGLPLCSEQLNSIRQVLVSQSTNSSSISTTCSSMVVSEKMICLQDEDLYSIENTYWMEQLEEILKDVLSELQVENHISGLIRKNSLIIAAEGCSDIPIESVGENSFVKLIVRLPSHCEGGNVVVNSGKISYNFNKGSCYSNILTACYSNIDATIKGITKGCATYLVFDICHQNGCETPKFHNSKEIFSNFMEKWVKSPFFVMEYKKNSAYHNSITNILHWYINEHPTGSLQFEIGKLDKNNVLTLDRFKADFDVCPESLLFSKGDREIVDCIIIFSRHFTSEIYLNLGMEAALDYLKKIHTDNNSQITITLLKNIIEKYSNQLDSKKIVDYVIDFKHLELAKLVLSEVLCRNFNHEVLFKLVETFTLHELREEVIKVLTVCFKDHFDGCVSIVEALNCPTVSASVLPQCSLNEHSCTCSQLEKVLDLASKFDIVIEQIPQDMSKLEGNSDEMFSLCKKVNNKKYMIETLQRCWKCKTINSQMIVECVQQLGLTVSRDSMKDVIDDFCSSHSCMEILETIGSFSQIFNPSNDAPCDYVMLMLTRKLTANRDFTIEFVHQQGIPYLKQLTNKQALAKNAIQLIAKHCLNFYNLQTKTGRKSLQPVNCNISHIVLPCSCEICTPVQEFLKSNEKIYTIPTATRIKVEHLADKISEFYSDILLCQTTTGKATIEKILLQQTKNEIKEAIAFLNSLQELALMEDDVE